MVQVNIVAMLKKLNEMYDKEEEIKKDIVRLEIEWQQLQEDKELLQTMIMHQSNKKARINDYNKMS
jgi:hypothetical protein